jgi:hypothetical protein
MPGSAGERWGGSKLQDTGKANNTNWQDVGAWLRAFDGSWTRPGRRVPRNCVLMSGTKLVVSTLGLCFPCLQFYKPAASFLPGRSLV